MNVAHAGLFLQFSLESVEQAHQRKFTARCSAFTKETFLYILQAQCDVLFIVHSNTRFLSREPEGFIEI